MGKFSQKLAGNLVSRLTGETVVPDEERLAGAPPKKKKNAPAANQPTVEEKAPAKPVEPAVPSEEEPTGPADAEKPGAREESGPAPTEGPDPENEAEDPEKKAKRKKLLLIGGIAVGAIVGIMLLVSVISGGASSKVNLLDTADLKLTERVSGYGRVEASIKEDVLTQRIMESGAMLPQGVTAADVTKTIIDGSVITVEPDGNLSNGDTVRVTITIDESVIKQYPGLSIEGGTRELTAEGMVEGEFFDPFAPTSINVRFEGNSGSANAYLDILAKGSHIYYLNYDWAPKTGLKNGDIVTVTIRPMESKLSELGYAIPETRTYEVPVGGLNEMVTAPGDIPDTYLNSMVSYAEGKLAEAFTAVPYVEGQDIIVTAPEITSIYFLDKADKSSPYSDWFTGLQMTNGVAVLGHFFVQDIEPVTTKAEDGTETTANEVVETYGGYYVWIFPDMVKKPGGDFSYNQSMITSRTTSYQTEPDCVVWIKNEFSGFSVQKIGTNTNVL